MLSIFLNRNDSIAQLARFECLHELFEAQADLNPHHIAIICDEQTYTYETLEEDANQLAHLLKAKRLGKGSLVGILLERSYDEFVVLLAILKVGAAYLPLDPHYPSERLNYILSDAKADFIITQAALKHPNPNLETPALMLEELKTQIVAQSKARFCRSDTGVGGLDLCYIIYTSGSTGRPKGVQITHQGVCNYVRGASSVYGVEPQDRVYHGFSIAFDAAVEEVWITFFNGASLIVATKEEVRSGARLAEFLSEQNVTVFSTVPTVLSMMETEVKNIRILISGGETLQQELHDRWAKPDRRIFNTYGPTETAVVATYVECSSQQPVTIGLPLPNYEIYILN